MAASTRSDDQSDDGPPVQEITIGESRTQVVKGLEPGRVLYQATT